MDRDIIHVSTSAEYLKQLAICYNRDHENEYFMKLTSYYRLTVTTYRIAIIYSHKLSSDNTTQ